MDKHFPPGSPLHPLLNRKKVKLSYRCLPNVKAHIAKHNSKLLREPDLNGNTEKCICKDPPTCPLPNRCNMKNVVYQATVKARGCEDANYVGLTARPFKTRYGEHKGDFENLGRKNNTKLAVHVWGVKEGGETPEVTWDVVCRAAPSTPSHAYAICAPPKNGTLSSN